MKHIILPLLFFFCSCLLSLSERSSVDEYVDEILINVRRFIEENNYDPMALPDYAGSFQRKIAFVDVVAQPKLYGGQLSGISSIHRTDHCTIDSNRTTIAISAHLGLNNLKFKYKGEVLYLNVGSSLECHGSIEQVSYNFTVLQSNEKGSTPHLQDIKIINMSTIKIEISGLHHLTWVKKDMETDVAKLVKRFVVKNVTASLREYVQEELHKVAFPM